MSCCAEKTPRTNSAGYRVLAATPSKRCPAANSINGSITHLRSWPEHRAVILLREVEGLSYDEISEILQCPRGTVMSRLHYARNHLRAVLKDLGGG